MPLDLETRCLAILEPAARELLPHAVYEFIAAGARLWLDWGRTIIAGQSAPRDFAATLLYSDSVGRIRAEEHGPSTGTWSWS